MCSDGQCFDIGSSTTGATSTDPTSEPTPQSTTAGPTTSADITSSSDSGDDTSSIKLDVGDASDVPTGPCAETGCKRVDMLFAIDSSLSMVEEIEALSTSAAFSSIVTALDELNCGGIEYRIGLTNDNDGGWIGFGGDPWFDSTQMTADEITAAFSAAADTVLGNGGTGLGCEHVLSSATDLLANDDTGFLRPDALLVLVLITDVDDYGYYDQAGWDGCQGSLICPCDSLCPMSGQPVETIQANLVALKDADENGVATVVVAGDPAVTEGTNLCSQPASCCGQGGLECAQALHAPRLFEFASLQVGTNGYTADICAGAQAVPAAIQDALQNDIDLACQSFQPEG